MRRGEGNFSDGCSVTGRSGTMSSVELKHSGNEALMAFWTGLRAGRPAPYRAEITAQSLGRTLASHVFILESLGGGELRFRLAGGALSELFGMELRGMSAPALFVGADGARFASLAERALTLGAVAAVEAEAETEGEAPVRIEIALLPLRSDFGRLDRLMGAAHVLTAPGEAAPLISAAPRRLRLIAAAAATPDAPAATRAEPLAGFAEAPKGFVGRNAPKAAPKQKPSLREVTGGGDPATPPTTPPTKRRRDHLRLVKD